MHRNSYIKMSILGWPLSGWPHPPHTHTQSLTLALFSLHLVFGLVKMMELPGVVEQERKPLTSVSGKHGWSWSCFHWMHWCWKSTLQKHRHQKNRGSKTFYNTMQHFIYIIVQLVIKFIKKINQIIAFSFHLCLSIWMFLMNPFMIFLCAWSSFSMFL